MNSPSAYVSRACNAVKRCSHLQELVTCRSRVRFITQDRRDQKGLGGNYSPSFWKDLKGKTSNQITFFLLFVQPPLPAVPLLFKLSAVSATTKPNEATNQELKRKD
jgi:hypothetical protein